MSMEQVHAALGDIVNSATFTPEALKRMNDALARVQELEKRTVYLEQENKQLRNERAAAEAKYNSQVNRKNELETREAAVAKREAAMVELEKRMAVAEAKESVRKEVFDTIFKNTIVRESINRNVSETIGGQNYSSNSRSDNASTIRETE
jgi:vacuolar-type H+-ATPase subunit I/STV1